MVASRPMIDNQRRPVLAHHFAIAKPVLERGRVGLDAVLRQLLPTLRLACASQPVLLEEFARCHPHPRSQRRKQIAGQDRIDFVHLGRESVGGVQVSEDRLIDLIGRLRPRVLIRCLLHHPFGIGLDHLLGDSHFGFRVCRRQGFGVVIKPGVFDKHRFEISARGGQYLR